MLSRFLAKINGQWTVLDHYQISSTESTLKNPNPFSARLLSFLATYAEIGHGQRFNSLGAAYARYPLPLCFMPAYNFPVFGRQLPPTHNQTRLENRNPRCPRSTGWFFIPRVNQSGCKYHAAAATVIYSSAKKTQTNTWLAVTDIQRKYRKCSTQMAFECTTIWDAPNDKIHKTLRDSGYHPL